MRRTTPLSRLVLFAALVMLAVPSLAAARGWLGVYTQEVTRDLRDALDLTGEGVLVSSVVPGSPADRAGLRKGDVIVSVDRRDVESPAELTEIIGDTREGESVSLGVLRKGEKLNLAVRLAERPDDDEIAPPAPPAPRAPKAPRVYRWHSDGNVDPDEIRERVRGAVPGFDFDFDEAGPGRSMVWMGGSGRGRLGVRVESLSEDLASALGAPGTRGALVVEVLKQTPAEEAGLRAGDIITAVEGAAVQDADDLVKALKGESGRVSVSIVRRGEKRTVEAALEDSPRVIRLRDGKEPTGPGRLGDDRRFDVRIKGDADGEDLRRELQELREQLRELRRELQENRR
jgi:serine protease Do